MHGFAGLAFAALAALHFPTPSPDAPYREPQLASSADFTALAYGSGQAIYVRTSKDGGKTFSIPVKVAEAHVLPLNRHRGPRVAISRGVLIVTAVAGHTEATGEHSHGLPSDGDLLAWRSTDGGKTWSKGVRVNDVPAAPREGLHTLAADGHGKLFAAWLDQRQLDQSQLDQRQRKEGARLFGAYSDDAGATWSKNVMLYESPSGTICECCHPTAAFAPDGTLDVMWRNVLDGSRDFYLLRAANGRDFAKAEKLGQGTWKINACPMDGGGLVHDGHRTITAWRREEDVFLSEPGKPEVKLGAGKDVALAASRGQTYAVWIQGTRLVWWDAGKLEVLGEKAAFPSVIALSDGGALAAWEENGGISVKRLP